MSNKPGAPKPTQTRRGFLAILGVAAAAVAIGPTLPPEAERPRSPWTGKTRWIGHC